MKLTRDQLLAVGLLLLLIVITFVAGFLAPDMRQVPPYASFSNAPEGMHALMLWLEALGYSTNSEAGSAFAVPDNTAVMLMLEPTEMVSDGQWRRIDEWINGGGTLIMAGDSFYLASMLSITSSRYGTSVQASSNPAITLVGYPLVVSCCCARTFYLNRIVTFMVHLASGRQPVLVSFRQSAGRVVISTAPFLFSNLGLKQAGNPPLALNLINIGRRSGAIWFDEWHHGVRGGQEISGLAQWLVRSATGRALLFIAIVAFGALVLRGAFGQPLRRRPTSRGGSAEYVQPLPTCAGGRGTAQPS
jgi:hypothetical protein